MVDLSIIGVRLLRPRQCKALIDQVSGVRSSGYGNRSI
ncbi:hypothetical protein BN2537_9987 [Streptomyces venezuelae]|nr:hypothetical protein BN2537_9987 [Streptomyces venezuelae]